MVNVIESLNSINSITNGGLGVLSTSVLGQKQSSSVCSGKEEVRLMKRLVCQKRRGSCSSYSQPITGAGKGQSSIWRLGMKR